ncbi:MAG: hypothetical protein KAQ87_01175 [Candidatus Pacebacteria bacterium]|nr:hypothetical protein [Candidatus Paceibacterota bacterium]
MSDSDELKRDITVEFSNEYADGSVILYRKYRGHKLFEFLEKDDWGSVVETLEEILESKYSMISNKAWNFKETRYYGDERGGEIYIERIRRIQSKKRENIDGLIKRCKNM